jgi:hypothetical protein
MVWRRASMSRRAKGRKGLRRLARIYAVYSVLFIMLFSVVPVMAVAPPGTMEIPEPEDWGVPAYLAGLQEREGQAINDPLVITHASTIIDGIVSIDGEKESATGDWTLHDTTPPPPTRPTVLDLVPNAPNGTLPGAFQILLDQPLLIKIFVKSGNHSNWVDMMLRPDLDPTWDGLLPSLVNWQRWQSVNVDNNTNTGDEDGNDVRLRIVAVIENQNISYGVLPLNFGVSLRGGVAVEVERLGSGSEDLPLDVTFIKSFRYSGINYTWFIEYDVDRIPERGYMSITADQVNVSVERGKLMDILQSFMANETLRNGTSLGSFAGPYTIYHTASENLGRLHATIGYMKIISQEGVEGARFEEASWIAARINPPSDTNVVPRTFSLWFDSPSFNRSFDQMIWTADRRSYLELEYSDSRENDTQVMARVYDAPALLAINIGSAMEDVGSVAKIHFTASSNIPRIVFDEWDFMGGDRRKYLHIHVELAGLPRDTWLNGTLDVGGQPIETLRPDPTVRSFVPQLMDSIMVGVASKLFNIGQTLRSLPENVLNMPDKEGYTTVEFANERDHLGKIEMWLTSDHYVKVEEGVDYFAFYNDTIEPEGRMVQTGFSARILDLRAFSADFGENKRITLDSRYNREFKALFIDVKNDANASIVLSNIPHNISLELMDDGLLYMGDGTVDRIQYTSQIGEQFIRMRMDGVPGGVDLQMGDDVMGVSILVGEIDTLSLQISDGQVRQMDGDHLMLEIDPMGRTAASLQISGLRGLQLHKGEPNVVSLKTGGKAMNILMSDATSNFELRAQLDPLQMQVMAEVTDVLGLSDLQTGSGRNVTNVLEFSSVIFAISDLATDVLEAVSDATVEVINSLGTFSSNVSFAFEGDRNMDLVASIKRSGSLPVPEAWWAHGMTAYMLPDGDDVLIDAKIFLTGISPVGSIELTSTPERTVMDLDLQGFAPQYKELVIFMEGASLIEGGGGKDMWLYMADLVSPLDLDLHLDIAADTAIGGRTEADLRLRSSSALGTDIILQTTLSQTLAFAFVKMSRDLSGHDAPATSITLHNVPTLVSLEVKSGGGYDMDRESPVANLPSMTVGANDASLDVLVDIEGRSLGNKADLFMDARNIKDLSMARHGDEYRISAANMEFVNLRISNIRFSETTSIDRIDILATDLTKATVTVKMVFGVYPLIDVDDLTASGLQLGITGEIFLRGQPRLISIMIFDIPLSLSTTPASHSDGVAVSDMKNDHRLFIPGPMTTLMVTLMG